MDVRTVEYLWQALTIFQAREQLVEMNSNDWPNLKKNKRQELHRELYKKAYPHAFENKKQILTMNDLLGLQAVRAKSGL